LELGRSTLEDLVVMPSPEFWSGRRVLITGHTGFKGSWLSLWLQELGATVSGYALEPPTDPNLFSLAGVEGGMKSTLGDVNDLSFLNEQIGRESPEVVIHMAAQALVRDSYKNPVETYATNVMGTVNVLEAVRHHDSVKAVLIVTSDKCYENRQWVWPYRENEALGGKDPYSGSKACAEIVTDSYRSAFFDQPHGDGPEVAIASARAGNVIGGGDWARDRLVPDCIRAFQQDESIQVRNPTAIRPWQHVLEPLAGYLLVLERLVEEGGRYTGAWNFAPRPDNAQTVEWIVDYLVRRWPGGAAWEKDSGPHPHEAQFLKLDGSKAQALLDFSPRLALGEALDWVVDWYWAVNEGADMRRVTLDQIAAYQALTDTPSSDIAP